MRLHPPTAVLGIVAAGLAATTAIEKEHSLVGNDERCAVLRAYIDIKIRDGVAIDGTKPVMVSHARPYLNAYSTIEEVLSDPETPYSVKTNPLNPLYYEQERTAEVQPVDTCPDLLNGLNGFEWLEEDYSFANKFDADVGYTVVFFGLSMPAISEDGQQAILESAFTFAPLAGGGQSVIMQKDNDGKWRVLVESPTWIS